MQLEFYEIYDIWYEPHWLIQYKLWIIAACGISVALAVFYYFYKKTQKCHMPCWQRALDDLARLTFHDHKKFYFELTTLLKNYLHERYQIDVQSKTDDEIVEYIEKNGSIFASTDELKKIFGQTTLVKFAQYRVNQAVLNELRALSTQMIKNSIPQPSTAKRCTT